MEAATSGVRRRGGSVYPSSVRIGVALLVILAACGSNRGAGGPRSVAARARMATVRAGPFRCGRDTEAVAPDLASSPSRTIDLAAFAIDRVLVTEREFQRFLGATGRRSQPAARDAFEGIDPRLLARHDRARGDVMERYGAHPAVLVGWDDARDYCAWRGLRLPTEEEREKAVRGTDGRAFPWGDRADPSRINSRELGPGDTTPVLSWTRDASPFDVHDGAGNVAEWTSSPGPTPSHFIVRGSAWNEPADAARADRRRELPRDARSITVGFRCATSATP